jgi:hypothetical protein
MTFFQLPTLSPCLPQITYQSSLFTVQHHKHVEDIRLLDQYTHYKLLFKSDNIYESTSDDLLGGFIVESMYPLRKLKLLSTGFEPTRRNNRYHELVSRLKLDAVKLVGWTSDVPTLVQDMDGTPLIDSGALDTQTASSNVELTTLKLLPLLTKTTNIVVRIPCICTTSMVSLIATLRLSFTNITLHHLVADDVLYLYCEGFISTNLTSDIISAWERSPNKSNLSFFTEEYCRTSRYTEFTTKLFDIMQGLYNWRYEKCESGANLFNKFRKLKSSEFSQHINIILDDIYKDVSSKWYRSLG